MPNKIYSLLNYTANKKIKCQYTHIVAKATSMFVQLPFPRLT